MSKPREFWIDPEDISWREDFHEGNLYSTGQREGTIHYREVVPIDWKKVWEVLRVRQYPNSEYQFIRELVEKALKGEL